MLNPGTVPEHTTRYALHFGSAEIDPFDAQSRTLDRLQDVLRDNWWTMPLNVEAFVDGDPFRVWGEPPTAMGPGDYLHVVVAFDLPTDDHAAWLVGSRLWLDLAAPPSEHVMEVATVHANCWPSDDAHVPFAVTLHEDWSIGITARGERR